MRQKSIIQNIDRIDALFKKSPLLQNDFELISHWSRYLCILVSGLIEETVRIIYIDYARKNGHINVANFVSSELKDFQNAKYGKILDLVKKFSPEWGSNLENALFLKPEVKDAIDSVVSNRHLISHGKDTGISLSTIQSYYNEIKRFIEILLKLTCS